jgi:hypothetical protein
MSLGTLGVLPRELLHEITLQLDYPTRIALGQCNRYLMASASPQTCSTEEKRAFVRMAESFPQHATNLGCYRCLRVLPRSNFADKQIRKSRGKGNSQGCQRFCFSCALEASIYCPGSRVTKDGIELWVCYRCRKPKAGWCARCRECAECLRLYQNNSAQISCNHDALPGPAPPQARLDQQHCPIMAWGLAWRMAEFEEDFGQIASPEWFDGDDLP